MTLSERLAEANESLAELQAELASYDPAGDKPIPHTDEVLNAAVELAFRAHDFVRVVIHKLS